MQARTANVARRLFLPQLGLSASFETQLLQTALIFPSVLSRVALLSSLDVEFEVAPLKLFTNSITQPCSCQLMSTIALPGLDLSFQNQVATDS